MKLSRLALAIAVIAALVLLLAGPGTRLGLWDFRMGFGMMRWSVFIGLAGAVLAAVMLLVRSVRRTQARALAIALVLGLGVAFVPWNAMRGAKQVPPIHDISTDTANPPAFVAILPLRADAPNPASMADRRSPVSSSPPIPMCAPTRPPGHRSRRSSRH